MSDQGPQLNAREFLEGSGNDFDRLTAFFEIDPSRDLKGCSLASLDFSNSNLIGANFCNCDLTAINFTNSDLTSANFDGAKILGASFKNATLKNVYWGAAQIEGCDFSGTDIPEGFFSVIQQAQSPEYKVLSGQTSGLPNSKLSALALEFADKHSYSELVSSDIEGIQEDLLTIPEFKNAIDSEVIDWDRIRSEIAVSDVDEEVLFKSNLVVLIVEKLQIENVVKGLERRQENDEEEEVEDESAYEDEEEAIELDRKTDALISKYSYKNEISQAFSASVQRIPVVGFLYRNALRMYALLQYVIELFKSAIKKLLRMMGFENLIVGIDWLSESSRTAQIAIKTVGTIIVPVMMMVTIFYALVRILNNPSRSFMKWLSKELDFKLPTDEAE